MIKEGMFVSCPVKTDSEKMIYLLGKVISINNVFGTCEVTFGKREDGDRWGIISKNKQTFWLYEVERSEIQDDSIGWVEKEKVIIRKKAKLVCKSEGLKDFYVYYCEFVSRGGVIKPIPECRLSVDCSMVANMVVLAADNFMNNFGFLKLRNVLTEKKKRLDVTNDVVKSVLGTRVCLYKHQLESIIRATQNDLCRVMLADEVGLGKTIEAIAIIKYFLEREASLRCLIIVPVSLEYQWIDELREKFDINTDVLLYSDLVKKRSFSRITVISYSDYLRYYYEIENKNWGMVVVDEAHKILNHKIYNYVCKQCKVARHVLLLSATPVLRHANEYLKLLKLLDYARYREMTLESFSSMVANQGKIHQSLFEISSDLEIFGDDGVPSIFYDSLLAIASLVDDRYLNALLLKCNDHEPKGMFYVKMALAYVKQKYVIETPIIRHRRNDIPEAQINRCLDEEVLYQMEGMDEDVYEQNVYQLVVNELDDIIKRKKGMDMAGVINLIQAVFSSPYAVERIIEDYVSDMEDFSRVRAYLTGWKNACDMEIKGDKSRRFTRFSKLRKVVERCKESKVLIFSEFKETVKAIEVMLKKVYGEKSVTTFVSGMSRFETQMSAKKFQNDSNCKFMVCDKCGGEGKNFQIADYIIHFDMPWSPALMEQRIGRLDRIGRELSRDVRSIVICSSDTIEHDLYKIFRDSLRVFDHSLCGLEIVFEELQNMIISSFVKDLQFGLSHVMNEIEKLVSTMEKEVEDEIYFANVQNDNDVLKKGIEEIINAFDEREDDKTNECYLSWLEKVGVPYIIENKIDGKAVTLQFSNCNHSKVVESFYDRVLIQQDIEGTFSRKCAISRDDLEYFSTSSEVIRDVFKNLQRNQKGRFAAVRKKNARFGWKGWLVSWSIKPDTRLLIKQGLYQEYYRYLCQFISEPFFYTIIKEEGTEEYNEYEIRSMLSESNNWEVFDSYSDIRRGDDCYDEDGWKQHCKQIFKDAEINIKEHVESLTRSERLSEDYLVRVAERMIRERRESISDNMYFIQDELYKAIKNPYIEMESLVYIEL